jgi:hypothetical protein
MAALGRSPKGRLKSGWRGQTSALFGVKSALHRASLIAKGMLR